MLTVDTARFRSSLVCASDRIDGLKYSLRTNTVQLLNRFISLTWRHILILLGCSTVLDNLDNLRLRCSLRAFVFRLFTHSQWWRLDHIFQRAAVDNQRRPRGGSNKNIKKKGGGGRRLDDTTEAEARGTKKSFRTGSTKEAMAAMTRGLLYLLVCSLTVTF